MLPQIYIRECGKVLLLIARCSIGGGISDDGGEGGWKSVAACYVKIKLLLILKLHVMWWITSLKYWFSAIAHL